MWRGTGEISSKSLSGTRGTPLCEIDGIMHNKHDSLFISDRFMFCDRRHLTKMQASLEKVERK